MKETISNLKLSKEDLELNIKIRGTQMQRILTQIANTDWDTRKTIKAGKCLNADVFWCDNKNGSFSVLIGEDDEIWEIGAQFPNSSLQKLKDA